MRDDAAVSSGDTGPDQAARAVRVLAAGGTIAMRGEQAVPALDASELVRKSNQAGRGTLGSFGALLDNVKIGEK